MTTNNDSVTSLLPRSEQIDVGALAGLFRDRSTSYKYFFFMAILDRIDGAVRAEASDISRPIPLSELAVDMVLAAWYPHGFCRLSFGPQDMLQRAVDTIRWEAVRGSWIQSGGQEWRRLHDSCASQLDTASLVGYVPYRLLRPFFAAETRGLTDYQVNDRIARLADGNPKSPYFFTADRRAIILEPHWLEYLSRNSAILRGWARYSLAEYLQARNPSVPGIIAKIAPPLARESLARQSRWWNMALALLGNKARCIYSGQVLSASEISLDHYLPWSFVTHDKLWNLIPVPRAINSAKSDNIPAEKYLDTMVELHYAALSSLHRSINEGEWVREVEPFLIDLQLDKAALLDQSKLRAAYRNTYQPLTAIAQRQGFAGEWEFQTQPSQPS